MAARRRPADAQARPQVQVALCYSLSFPSDRAGHFPPARCRLPSVEAALRPAFGPTGDFSSDWRGFRKTVRCRARLRKPESGAGRHKHRETLWDACALGQPIGRSGAFWKPISACSWLPVYFRLSRRCVYPDLLPDPAFFWSPFAMHAARQPGSRRLESQTVFSPAQMQESLYDEVCRAEIAWLTLWP